MKTRASGFAALMASACAARRSLSSIGVAAAHCAFSLLQSIDGTPKAAGTAFRGPELLQNIDSVESDML